MSFDGKLLTRGFWLYVWDIRAPSARYLYVGRTGDSSSANAASPFARIGQHLNLGSNARANSIARRLKEKGVSPDECDFEMLAIGPIFREQDTFDKHVPFRDEVAALERALAVHLRHKGYTVLGIHHTLKELDEALFRQVSAVVDKRFPPL